MRFGYATSLFKSGFIWSMKNLVSKCYSVKQRFVIAAPALDKCTTITYCMEGFKIQIAFFGESEAFGVNR